MHRFDTILFDLDGTLTDPALGITNSVMYSLEKFGIPVPDRTKLYPFIGPPLLDSYMERFGMTKEEAEQAIAYYREYFKEKGLFENTPYPGISEMLAALKAAGKRLYLATSKPIVFAERILEHFSLAPYFNGAVGATLDGKLSEKEDVIAEALRRYQITDLSHTAMVGDRKFDILGAKKNHLISVGVLFGYGSHEELTEAGADHLAETVDDLRNILS